MVVTNSASRLEIPGFQFDFTMKQLSTYTTFLIFLAMFPIFQKEKTTSINIFNQLLGLKEITPVKRSINVTH